MNSMKYETLFREIKRKEVTTTAWGLGAQCKKKENQLNKEKNPQEDRNMFKNVQQMSFKV